MTRIPIPGRPVRGSRSGAPLMALFDILGRRWAMGVLWNLCESGPLRFRALQERCETVSPAVLNTRLKELRTAGLAELTDAGYTATALGQGLFEHLVPMRAWSHRWAAELGVNFFPEKR